MTSALNAQAIASPCPSNLQPLRSNLQNLIETLRLGFLLTLSKQNHFLISNRDRNGIFFSKNRACSGNSSVQPLAPSFQNSNREFGITLLPNLFRISALQISNRNKTAFFASADFRPQKRRALTAEGA